MLIYILQVSICWGGLYLLYLVLLSRNTFFTANRVYLNSSILIGILLPLLSSSIANAIISPVNIEVVSYLPTIMVNGSSGIAIPQNAAISANKYEVWNTILWSIYFLGLAIGGCRFWFGLWQIRQLYQHAEVKQQEGYKLVLTEQSHTPFSFFKLLFWSKQHEFDANDQKRIIQHEQAHMNGWHSLDILALEILSILFWPSPIIYLYCRAMRAVHEFLADAEVLKTTIKKKQYGHLLLRQSQSGMSIALANHFFHSQLKKRIIMMTKAKSKQHLLGHYLFALPVVVLLALAFAMPLNQQTEAYTVAGDGILPIFSGCESLDTKKEQQQCSKKMLVAFIQDHLKYPKEAKEAEQEGKVLVEFTVNKEGYVESATIVGSAGYGMDEAALRVVNAFPRWTPAQENGKAVATKLTIPFIFALPKKENNSDVYEVVDEMPRFPGCESETDATKRKECSELALLKHLYNSLKYPKDAMEADAQGTVVASFVINKEGYIEDAKIVRSVYPSLDAQVLKITQAMNEMPDRWIPGKHDDKIVKVRYNLPVLFRIDSDKEDKEPAGAAKALNLKQYSISPNPSNGHFNLSFEAEAQPVDILIVDVNGQTIWQAHIDNFSGFFNREIDLGSSSKGTLVLQIQQGEQVYTDKISLQ